MHINVCVCPHYTYSFTTHIYMYMTYVYCICMHVYIYIYVCIHIYIYVYVHMWVRKKSTTSLQHNARQDTIHNSSYRQRSTSTFTLSLSDKCWTILFRQVSQSGTSNLASSVRGCHEDCRDSSLLRCTTAM